MQPCGNHRDLHICKIVKLFWHHIICKCGRCENIFFCPSSNTSSVALKRMFQTAKLFERQKYQEQKGTFRAVARHSYFEHWGKSKPKLYFIFLIYKTLAF